MGHWSDIHRRRGMFQRWQRFIGIDPKRKAFERKCPIPSPTTGATTTTTPDNNIMMMMMMIRKDPARTGQGIDDRGCRIVVGKFQSQSCHVSTKKNVSIEKIRG